MRGLFVWLVLIAALGCPKQSDRDPIDEHPDPAALTGTADPAPSGKWSLRVISDAPGLNPDVEQTPEMRAKMFFDHSARIDGGKLIVDHGALKKSFTGTPEHARELEYLMTNTNWDTVKRTTQNESEGGTIFTFAIGASDGPIEIRTSNLDAHPELRRIVEILKETAGTP
jgi:hypothetical protein